jgi:hypothetical protein
LVWRRRVSAGAAWVMAIVVIQWVLWWLFAWWRYDVLNAPMRDAHIEGPERVMEAWRLLALHNLVATVPAGALVWATWLFTSTPPAGSGRALQFSRFGLRAAAIAYAFTTIVFAAERKYHGLAELGLAGREVLLLFFALDTLPVPLGLWYLAFVFAAVGAREVKRAWGMAAVSTLTGAVSALAIMALGIRRSEYETAALSVWIAAGVVGMFLLWRMRRTLRLVHHEWWLDIEALPTIEWSSLARYGSGAVELIKADGKHHAFDDLEHAATWLTKEGLVPAETATHHAPGATAPELGADALPSAEQHGVRELPN